MKPKPTKNEKNKKERTGNTAVKKTFKKYRKYRYFILPYQYETMFKKYQYIDITKSERILLAQKKH